MCDRLDPKNDLLHALVFRTAGKDSVKELTYFEAFRVLEELKKSRIAPGKMSAGQQGKAWALMNELARLSPSEASNGERMVGIVTKVTGVSCSKKNPFVWLSKKQGNEVIEMIKRYIETEKKKQECCQ